MVFTQSIAVSSTQTNGRTLVGTLIDPGRYSNSLRLDFDKKHNLHWGKLYEPQDVEVEWHGESFADILLLT